MTVKKGSRTATPNSKRSNRLSKEQYDEKVYGKKPDYSSLFSSNEIDEPEARSSELRYGLRWYSNLFDKKNSISFVTSWLRNQSYFDIKENDVKMVESNWNLFLPTFFAIMKMESEGWVLSEREISQIRDFVSEITVSSDENCETNDDGIVNDNTIESSKPKKSPYEYLKEKVNSSILSELEEIFEHWMFANNPADRNKEYNLNERIAALDIKGNGIDMVEQWIDSNLDELSLVKSKKDLDLVEGYSNVKPINLNSVIKKLTEMKNLIGITKSNLKGSSKVKRKPRKRKIVSLQKVFSKFKYKKTDKEFGVSSIDPERILDAKILYLFNVKYRTITVLYAKESFGVKGTTIQNIDETISFKQKIRKPNETIAFILGTSSKRKIESHLKSLSTKPSEASGRCGDDTILLKIL